METTTISNKPKIRSFLERFIPNREFQDTDDIFTSGYVTSLFVIQMVLFIEKEFNVTLDGEDLDNSNYRTIDAIDSLVGRKLEELEN